MGLEVILNGKSNIDLLESSSFQFNFTLGDLMKVGFITYSYSNAYDVPVTPNNTLSFNGLGLIGSTSQLSYKKNYCNVKYDGFDVVELGLLTVESTEKEVYKIGVEDAAADFFQDIENKTIGNDLDLSEIQHDKDVESFLRSYDPNSKYRYVNADFGGKVQLTNNTINIDYLIPVVKLSYFWNKIFETFGYTFSGSIFSNPDYVDAYITYPKAPTEGDLVETLLSTAHKTAYFDNAPEMIFNGRYEFPKSYTWNTSGPGFVGSWNYRAEITGAFRIKVKPYGYIRAINNAGAPTQTPFVFEVCRGTDAIASFSSTTDPNADLSNYLIDLPISQGEIISFRIRNFGGSVPNELYITSIDIEVYSTSYGTFDFKDAFSDFSILDYITEITRRYGLIMSYNKHTKNVHFVTMNERMNFNTAIDWSSRYIDRTSENYKYGSYAQLNMFAHRYNQEGDTFNNGTLTINNANIEASKTLVTSKAYSAEQTIRTYNIGTEAFTTNVYPIWQAQTRESADETIIEYKGLSGRYYIMKLQRVDNLGKYRSEKLQSLTFSTNYYFVANNGNVHFNDLVQKYYMQYQNVLNDFITHSIEVRLDLTDVLNLDLLKLYYFKQEAAFYILNKLQWNSNKQTHKGEFIRVLNR